MSGDGARQVVADDPLTAVREWFALFERRCAAADYAAAERLLADDVAGFGASMEIAIGRDVARREWRPAWENISNFKIDLDNIHAAGGGNRAWGAATWTSIGFGGDGKPFYRPGYATAILERRAGVWLAVHIHFSLYPGTPHRSFGRRRRQLRGDERL